MGRVWVSSQNSAQAGEAAQLDREIKDAREAQEELTRSRRGWYSRLQKQWDTRVIEDLLEKAEDRNNTYRVFSEDGYHEYGV